VFTGVTPGGELIDLAHGCKMIDNSNLTATCSGATDHRFADAQSFAGG